MNNLKYYLAAILAFSIWGTFSLVLKPLHSYPSLDILFYRVFSCAIIMTVVSVLFKRKKIQTNLNYFKLLPQKSRREMIVLNVGSSILLTANWFSFIYVMNHVSVRATSVAYLVSQNKNTKFDKFLVLNFHILLSALILLPFFPAFSGPIPTDFKFYFYVEIIAVLYTIIPLLLNLFALSGIASSKVGMILNINPIIAFVLAGVVYHEPLGVLQIFSYALIFLAVIVFNGNQIFKIKDSNVN